MTFMDLALAAAGLPVLGAALYLLGLTCLWGARRGPAAGVVGPRFVVLVPAHDEQAGIARTLASLDALEYPRSLRRVVVVADNCTDETAGIAAGRGAEVIVRHDAERRGKGYALEFAIGALLEEPADAWDVLVVIDADSVVSPNLLRAFAARVTGGEQAVQAAYLPRTRAASDVGVITEVAFVAFHLVRSAARERLGLSCGLRGNGMAFRRDLLVRVPHSARSRTEDVEFGVLLGLHGVRVAFAGDALVEGDMPEQQQAVGQQRERWIGGRVALARRLGPALVRDAIVRRSAMLADLAVDLLVPPVSALAAVSVLGLGAAVLLAIAQGTLPAAAAVWLGACAALAAHVAHAAAAAVRGRALARAVPALPGYALRKTRIAGRALRSSDERWIRTMRAGEEL
jgi:1,2-diacylglycerol 3-beta-glucosyltransferase